ncbi:hypothetical protein OJAV_G00040000 [Oryzias javanicus]|uniref:Uncharacterized protein n=1 Tax=Oryzias javanicus TaxID=123683 RepID=A0A437DBZ2_ORYJA|nr:hypothetical protein OJAV_G00040000 [Oryzias javanicus]
MDTRQVFEERKRENSSSVLLPWTGRLSDHMTQDKMNFSTPPNMQGLHAPLKLQMKNRTARQTLRSSDDGIGFEDILSDPDQSEMIGEPHMMVEYKLRLEVSPDVADKLPVAVDVAHRPGPRADKERSSSSSSSPIWRDAGTSTVLKQKKVRILEDLTQSGKEARNELWRLGEQARKDGTRAASEEHLQNSRGLGSQLKDGIPVAGLGPQGAYGRGAYGRVQDSAHRERTDGCRTLRSSFTRVKNELLPSLDLSGKMSSGKLGKPLDF